MPSNCLRLFFPPVGFKWNLSLLEMLLFIFRRLKQMEDAHPFKL